MNRNRVIIAAGIALLLVIGLFFWLGGDEPSDVPVADLAQPGAGSTGEAGGAGDTEREAPVAAPAGETAVGPSTAQIGDGEVGDGQDGSGQGASEQGASEQAAGEQASGGPAPQDAQIAAAPVDDRQVDIGQVDVGQVDDGQGDERQLEAEADGDARAARRGESRRAAAGAAAPAADANIAGQPAASDTAASDPAASDPAASDPAASDPAASDTAARDRTVGDLAAANGAAGDAARRAESGALPGGDTRRIVAAPDARARDGGGEVQADASARTAADGAATGGETVPLADAQAIRERGADVPVGVRGPDPASGLAANARDEPSAATPDEEERPAAAAGRDGRDAGEREVAALPPRQERQGAEQYPAQDPAQDPAPRDRIGRDGIGPDGIGRERSGATEEPQRGMAGYPLPSFDIVRISRDCRAVIAGRAMPQALVVVSLGEDRLGQVTADRRGEWVLIPDLPLRPGSGEIRLSATPKDGPAVAGREGVIVAVPDCAGGRQQEEIIAVQTDDRDGRPSRILQMPGASGTAGGLRLDTVDYDEAGKLILSGRADPRVRVNIYANNAPVGQVHSDSEGRWSLLVDDKVPVGEQMLRLDQVGDRGRVESRVEFPFSRARLSDLDFSKRNVIVQPGNSLWRIARRVYGEGLRYTVIYRANTEQIRDPDLIYPGQIFALPGEEGAAGRG